MLMRRNGIKKVGNKYCASNWSVGPCWMPKGKPCKRKPACPSCKSKRGIILGALKKIVLHNVWIFITDEARKRYVLWFRGDK